MSGSKSSVLADPPDPLQLTIHGLSAKAVDAAPRRKLGGRLTMLLVLLVCAAPVVLSYFTYFVVRPEGRSNYGTLILPTPPLSALKLSALDGEPVAARSLHGQWSFRGSDIPAARRTADGRGNVRRSGSGEGGHPRQPVRA